MQLARPGGVIAFDNDNMFWNGRVLNEQDQEKSTKSIRALNEKLKKDPRINLSIIPIDDGLKLVQKVGG
ncbi:MAG: hypothetical protein CMM74_06510 [Rhodospirillaceae bacterium]|nr:hypothetical protein [Rhodospirillaceae bacterium]